MIYEIVCNETGERYVGSTFEPTIAKRMVQHRGKTNDCMSKQIIGRGNYSYGLLEKTDVTTRDELRMMERKWYDKLDCINKNKPYQTKEERQELVNENSKAHYEANKEKVKAHYEANKEKVKAYYEANKEQKLEKTKAYREANREQVLEKRKAYRDANRELLNENAKAYYEANKELLKAKARLKYQAKKNISLETI